MRWEDNARSRFFYRSREHQRAQLELASDLVAPLEGRTILDVGCGYGDLLDVLPPGYRYTGIDPDAQAIEEARRLRPGHRFRCTDRLTRSDVVVSVAAIQCVTDPVGFARRLWRVTREILVVVSCKQERLPPERQGLDWWSQLPGFERFESEDDFYAVRARR